MADSVVRRTVTFALENLSRLLVDEVKLLSGVADEISSLRGELKFMHTFLKSSEGKGNSDVVNEVVSQIRDVTHQTEDVIDTYIVNVLNHRRRNMLGKCFHCKGHVFMLHEVDDQIKKIKVKIDGIYKNKAKYDTDEGDFKSRDQHNNVEQDVESLRRRRREVEEEEVVGLVHDSTVVIDNLKEENSPLSVISIIGMGGLGKTTLARKIYNKDEVKGMFSRCAWGYVSNDYRARELLLSILQCLNSSTSEYKDLSLEQLKEKVRECLKEKKYLVVLDDIWKTQVWDDVKQAFPDDKNGSKILITSRIREVALYPDPNSPSPYVLPFLKEEESWKLFCKKVFRGRECPDFLERLGREMVESCKGLPLAIIVLAGLVSKKEKSKREWERIRGRINRNLAEEKIAKHILKLSYDNLPRELKPCFLYLGIYPEDYEIPVRELIRLWIVEGFIQPEEIGTSNAPEPEDVADYYLDELVDRSLVQVASKRNDEGVKTCRIHDLLRELCLSESRESKFMEVFNGLNIDKCSSRRLSLHCKLEFSPKEYSQSHTRSLFLFGDELKWDGESKGWKWIRNSLKLTRVLDLNRVEFASSPPIGLETLIHLRYLSVGVDIFNSTIGNDILDSICNLWNLETLHLSTVGVTIPSGMWKLNQLRHVIIQGGAKIKQPAPMGEGENRETLVSLQTLCHVYVSPELVLMMNNALFPNLTKLSVIYEESSPQQLPGPHHLNKLRKLKITRLGFNLPSDANVFPPNLTKITLREFYGGLDSGFMNTLGQLGSLQILKLENGNISGSINCVAGSFPQLEVLQMRRITIEGQWRQEKGAMPQLRRLVLARNCEYLDEQEQRFRPYANDSAELSKIQLNSGCEVIIERIHWKMTDTIVESVVTFSLQNLCRLLADEVNLRFDAKAKIKSLSKELEFMDVFLKSSEGKREEDLVKVVVNQIRDLAYKAEDMVDSYIANVTQQRRRNVFNKLLHCLSVEVMLYDVDAQIEIIKRSIYEIYRKKDKYNIREGEYQSERSAQEEAAKSLKERRKDVEEEEVVGLVHNSTTVIENLKEENSHLSVISIIGMGGVGKTTLARKIYDKDEVTCMFSCRAWLCVSSSYRESELLLSLLQCLGSSTFEDKYLNVHVLEEKVRECLTGKKYLVVLDDLWTTEAWDELKGAFPDDKNGSRILITSRSSELAYHTGSNPPYYLSVLSENESWELFCKKVFRGEECPDDLKPLGRKMVKCCAGLPIAIIVLAGLVAKKDKLTGEWMRITDAINSHFAQDRMVMYYMIKLGYDNLPRELKPCFLYLGIYHEDCEIPIRELIQLWIAEGFIQPKGIGISNAPEAEDLAEYYLDELVDRNLVQVASKKSEGGVKTCRIHDLLRDLCLSESKANKFMEVCTEWNIDRCSSRRLSLHYKTKFLSTEDSQLHLRSLFLFGDKPNWDANSQGWKRISKNLKLARVLDLNQLGFLSSPPIGLKTLIHLRYLRVSVYDSAIGNNILASTCNLWNLETLYLLLWSRAAHGVTIPSALWKLKRLRHVIVQGGAEVKPPAHMQKGENSETVVSLQILGEVYVSPGLVFMMNNGFFPNLTKLSLVYEELSPQQFPSLHHLNKLRKLKITRFGFNLPSDANVFPPNLAKITLVGFDDGLDSGFMNTLGQLGSLRVLKLENGSISGCINCVAGSFPRLEVFQMKHISVKGQWRQEKDAMPLLRRLSLLNDCTYLDERGQLQHYAYGSAEVSKIQLNDDCKVIIEQRFHW